LNLSVALIWYLGERRSTRSLILFSLLIFAGAHAALFIDVVHLKAIYARPRFSSWSNVASDWRILTRLNSPLRIRSLYQWIDLVPPEFSAGVQGGQDFFLFLDRKIQLNANHSERYHQSLVEGAVNLLGRDPEHILILGGGDGALLPELLKFSSVQSIDLAEIDAKVLDLARTQRDLRRINRGALEDPKVHVHIADGFYYLRNQARTYDLILIDLPYPSNYDLSLLFTREFYALARRHLGANGLMALDFPTRSQEASALSILLHTLKAAGFERPFGFGGEDFFIAAARDSRPLRFDLPALFPHVGNSTLLNLISREDEIAQALSQKAPVNSIFFPRRFAAAGEVW
jgi:spermidine synthase